MPTTSERLREAVVIGAGPNGLAAANLLADAGWAVTVFEGQPEPGGAVRSGELVEPGFTSDLFSAFYPLGIASPVLEALDLPPYGLRWRQPPVPLANPLPDGRAIVLSQDLDVTAASVEQFGSGDGDAWRTMVDGWRELADPLLAALLGPFPPVRPALSILRRLGTAELLRFARFAVLPVRRMGEEYFSGMGAGLLLAGNALHSDLGPESPISGFLGYLLCMLAQTVGFPVPEGGAGMLTNALVRRLEGKGGRLVCNAPVTEVLVRAGRAAGVRLADGQTVPARAVLADVDAPQLYLQLLPREAVPATVLADIHRFQFDNATIKVDWTLDSGVPWTAEPVRHAGTVHLAAGVDHLTDVAHQLATQHVPAQPYLICGQMATADPSRAPAGKEVMWAYTHVPQRVRGDAGPDGLTGSWDEREMAVMVERIEGQIESYAPGFRDRIRARHVMAPQWLHEHNVNLVGGALGGGTSQLHQQLVFRPTPGYATARTFLPGLYLASASAHPGGGVHGACGANAAHAAVQDAGPTGWAWRRLMGAGRRGRRSVLPDDPTGRELAG